MSKFVIPAGIIAVPASKVPSDLFESSGKSIWPIGTLYQVVATGMYFRFCPRKGPILKVASSPHNILL